MQRSNTFIPSNLILGALLIIDEYIIVIHSIYSNLTTETQFHLNICKPQKSP